MPLNPGIDDAIAKLYRNEPLFELFVSWLEERLAIRETQLRNETNPNILLRAGGQSWELHDIISTIKTAEDRLKEYHKRENAGKIAKSRAMGNLNWR